MSKNISRKDRTLCSRFIRKRLKEAIDTKQGDTKAALKILDGMGQIDEISGEHLEFLLPIFSVVATNGRMTSLWQVDDDKVLVVLWDPKTNQPHALLQSVNNAPDYNEFQSLWD